MTEQVASRLLIVGSASVHTWRYLAGIAPYVGEVWLASNRDAPEQYRPANLAGFQRIDFRLSSLVASGRLRGWIKAIKPELVHVHQANSVAWHASRAMRGLAIPQVLTAWGSDILLLPASNALFGRMVRSNLQSADVITSDSLYMAARIRELAGDDCRIELLNYGMDALPLTPDLAAKEKRVLSCRLHKPLYRIDAILHAWAAVEASGRFPDWRLTVAASGDQTPELKRLAETLALRRVDFPGFIPGHELAELYRKSRVFISVPRSDATSISLLEAMGHGCLPVLSNLPANGEWIIDGLNGCIAEDMSRLSDNLVAAMQQAADDQRLQFVADINRQLVTQKALHADNMRRFAELYTRTLQAGPKQNAKKKK
ncbi:glycosyltransferase family 4 protein [Paludibacterium purpuratum]|uniref:Glycosyltransferase involved in cell wall biosynthesis n=1 Tax=Paludibacterium purpuratum TaxID=1144873 RepID=A0A4R7B6A5_9NEIS|nr:glycosyltransferase family 4 protein [Paludibacterium purpuratum]TDR80181.1 glycosyltransferase involved in cell wall biosynthesis [Paludibacterium purpuratum]